MKRDTGEVDGKVERDGHTKIERGGYTCATEQYQVVRTSVVGLPVRQATTNNTRHIFRTMENFCCHRKRKKDSR